MALQSGFGSLASPDAGFLPAAPSDKRHDVNESRGFTAREVIGLLPGGWSLADATDPGSWDDSGRQWRTRLIDGADVERELVVESEAMGELGRTEAMRRELDRVYRRIGGRGLFG